LFEMVWSADSAAFRPESAVDIDIRIFLRLIS
jgi:hypothetical protein